MPIEFRCTQCNQLLRVPDDAAGKSARCPKCQSLMAVPGAEVAAGGPLPAAGGAGMPPGSPGNPFGEGAGGTPFGGSTGIGDAPNLNPYAAPTQQAMAPGPAPLPFGPLPISPRAVPAETIFNYALQIWKANLGLLVGATALIAGVNYAITLPFSGVQAYLQAKGEEEAAVVASLVGSLLSNLVQMWLGIGMAQINLKLARFQPARFGELFGGIGLFLPVLGGGILAFLALTLGFLLFIVPGVLLALAFWPYYFLIVDRRMGVIESFQVAVKITEGNWGSGFLLWLMSVAIIMVGCAAICVGLLFAGPLVSMMFAVAYLMMSGQIPASPHPQYAPR